MLDGVGVKHPNRYGTGEAEETEIGSPLSL